ncbi:hypothetical protein NCPPB3778_36 [Rathayibacter phage NCPPB3778]|nr:hypothetical protein NCPPB3778_36 [Rathayibacter phage NCPPB3778]
MDLIETILTWEANGELTHDQVDALMEGLAEIISPESM